MADTIDEKLLQSMGVAEKKVRLEESAYLQLACCNTEGVIARAVYACTMAKQSARPFT